MVEERESPKSFGQFHNISHVGDLLRNEDEREMIKRYKEIWHARGGGAI